MTNVDVLVVGGGPAGSSLGARLAAAGSEVLLIDSCRFPRSKPCAECLSPAALPLLKGAGLLERVLALRPAVLNGFRITGPAGSSLLGRYGEEQGIALTRADLDNALLEGAVAAGADVWQEHLLVGLQPDRQKNSRPGNGPRLMRATLRGPEGNRSVGARLVVGADGIHSATARLAGMTRPARPWVRNMSLVAHYRVLGGPPDHGEIALFGDWYAGFARLPGGLANLNVVLPPDRRLPGRRQLRSFFEGRIARIPGWRERLEGAVPAGRLMACGPISSEARQPVADGVLLVGDAAGYVDPLTGEGIYLALESSMQAAVVILAALDSGRSDREALLAYARMRQKTFLPRRRFSWLLQQIVRRPAVADRMIRYAATRPIVAERLVCTAGDLLRPWDLIGPPGWRYLLSRPVRP